jgi:hypothetical protein
MTQLVLVVREPWHHKVLGRHILRGEVITDPAEVQKTLAERPGSVTKRMSVPHEDAATAAAMAAAKPVVAPAPAPVAFSPATPKSVA